MKSTRQEFGMEQIQVSVVFPRIDPDRLGNFKQIAGKMLDITRGDQVPAPRLDWPSARDHSDL